MKHDGKAQFELFNMYSKKLLGVAYRYAVDYDMANDMLQEGFIRIFNRINQYEFKGSFEGWMKRIIVTTSLNYLEKYSKMKFANDDINDIKEQSIEPNVLEEIECEALIDLINKLPINYRTILNLYAIEGYSYHEISKILEVKEVTIRSLYMRAKQKLTVLIQQKQAIEYNEKIV
jgi:RNA polymerase sigma factor (sigma-70 family)